MIVKFLGIFDMIAAAILLISFFLFQLNILIWIAGIYLIFKGAIFAFTLNIASILDILSGILILSSLAITLPIFVVMLISFFLVQKGIFSLL